MGDDCLYVYEISYLSQIYMNFILLHFYLNMQIIRLRFRINQWGTEGYSVCQVEQRNAITKTNSFHKRPY